MRKSLGWACLNAALIGWSGSSYAVEYNPVDESSVASYSDVNYEISPSEAIQGESGVVELCGHSDACCGASGPCVGNFLDNTSIFVGVDSFKSIGDRLTNINGGTGSLTGSFGGVAGFNTGFGLGDSKLRGQFGASYGVYDLRGRIRLVPEDNDVENQGFFTTGLYKRGDMVNDCDRVSYGAVIDVFATDNWGINANTINLGQVRYMAGYALNEKVEIGGFGSAHLWDDQAAVTVAGAPGVQREVRAANSLNGYLRGNTAFGGQLMAYAGGFDGADIQGWQFGLAGESPLSRWFSLYGNFNYAVPSANSGPTGSGEEQFSVQFGLAYYLGGKAVSPSVTGQKGLPLFDVANNSSFLITD